MNDNIMTATRSGLSRKVITTGRDWVILKSREYTAHIITLYRFRPDIGTTSQSDNIMYRDFVKVMRHDLSHDQFS